MTDDAVEAIGSLSETEYQAVYAELSATVHGRNFLTEHVRHNLPPDIRELVAASARLEAMRGEGRPVPAAELFRNLTDLAAAIAHCEAVVAENIKPVSDELFAAERIQDIALAMRRRDVEPGLCDALDTATSEIVDGIIANDAANRASNVTTLLRDLARRVDDIMALASCCVGSQTGDADQLDGSVRFDATVQEPAQEIIQDREIVRDPGAQVSGTQTLGTEADSVAKEDAVAKVVQSPESVTVSGKVHEPSDSYAAIFALSEAELIALFS